MMRCKLDTEIGTLEVDIYTPKGARPPNSDRATYIEGPPTTATIDRGPPVRITYTRVDGSVERVWVEGEGFIEPTAADR